MTGYYWPCEEPRVAVSACRELVQKNRRFRFDIGSTTVYRLSDVGATNSTRIKMI
jgi:hypothetical protein